MLLSDRYFLGANSTRGFVSLYDNILSASGQGYTYYIKAGPGAGKSTFLRRIARAAGEAGYDTELVFCSGDPASLDGVCIPELHLAYVDATAPHAQEPVLPGITGEYLMLECYKDPMELRAKESAFRHIRSLYRDRYRSAYELLGRLRPRHQELPDRRDIENRAGLLCRCLIDDGREPVEGARRFLSAFTGGGHVIAENPLYKCKTVLHMNREDAAAGYFLHSVYEECCRQGCRCIEFLSPLYPEMPELVLLPEELTAIYIIPSDGHLPVIGWPLPCLEDLPPAEICSVPATQREEILAGAQVLLGEAKAYHDTLEDMYHPFIDFSRQEEVLDAHIRRITGEG